MKNQFEIFKWNFTAETTHFIHIKLKPVYAAIQTFAIQLNCSSKATVIFHLVHYSSACNARPMCFWTWFCFPAGQMMHSTGKVNVFTKGTHLIRYSHKPSQNMALYFWSHRKLIWHFNYTDACLHTDENCQIKILVSTWCKSFWYEPTHNIKILFCQE